jgi:hypothetical protein
VCEISLIMYVRNQKERMSWMWDLSAVSCQLCDLAVSNVLLLVDKRISTGLLVICVLNLKNNELELFEISDLNQ